MSIVFGYRLVARAATAVATIASPARHPSPGRCRSGRGGAPQLQHDSAGRIADQLRRSGTGLYRGRSVSDNHDLEPRVGPFQRAEVFGNVHRVRLQHGQVDHLERPGVGCGQDDGRRDSGLVGLRPAFGNHTPSITGS